MAEQEGGIMGWSAAVQDVMAGSCTTWSNVNWKAECSQPWKGKYTWLWLAETPWYKVCGVSSKCKVLNICEDDKIGRVQAQRQQQITPGLIRRWLQANTGQ